MACGGVGCGWEWVGGWDVGLRFVWLLPDRCTMTLVVPSPTHPTKAPLFFFWRKGCGPRMASWRLTARACAFPGGAAASLTKPCLASPIGLDLILWTMFRARALPPLPPYTPDPWCIYSGEP